MGVCPLTIQSLTNFGQLVETAGRILNLRLTEQPSQPLSIVLGLEVLEGCHAGITDRGPHHGIPNAIDFATLNQGPE